ncbi:hypothetical protein CPC08DRAFT_766443 [Agrocybe pediades]|nr:hypothetical protein CPC08DRAFT_766443 [Agrocybe pediades]
MSRSFHTTLIHILEANYPGGITYEPPEPSEYSEPGYSELENSDHWQDSTDEEEQECELKPPQCHPYSFYDRHIASSLLLKQVVYVPSFAQSLSKAYDVSIAEIGPERMMTMPLDMNLPVSLKMNPETFENLREVCGYYMSKVGSISGYLATKVFFLPAYNKWESFIYWDEPDHRASSFPHESVLKFYRRYSLDADVDAYLGKATIEKISRLSKRSPRLATGHFFPMEEPSLSMLQSMTQTSSFDWEIPRTQGRKTGSHVNPPVDGNIKGSVMESFPASKTIRSRPTSSSKLKRGRRTTRSSKFIVPAKAVNHERYRPSLKHFIQCAWAKSVAHDTTFFILHCGRYERIGFRHRQSQTLYLSGVIDTINIQNPRYRKLHVGLHIEIVKDALRRLEIAEFLREDEEIRDGECSSGRKRAAEKGRGDERDSKRRKVDTQPRDASASEVAKELASRNLLLVELDYGIFCSPTPSSFIRVEPSCLPGPAEPVGKGRIRRQVVLGPRFPVKPRCAAHECAVLTLREKVGFGAIGVVHPGLLIAKTSSGETLQATLMLKLAFTEAQKTGLRNEYRIYSRLAAKAVVEGIIPVHGLFSDPESGALGLLMDHGGESLFTKVPSAAHKTTFKRVLENLRDVGILHGDIRPSNLLVRPDGSVFIVDFDRGVDFYTDSAHTNFEGEWKALEACLAGKHSDETDYYR